MKFIYTILCLLVLTQAQAQAVVRRVKAGNPSPGNGSTWALAYNNLQTAINASAAGDELWVAVPIGTAKYQPAVGASFTLRPGVKMYGGFNGTEAALPNRNIVVNVTILQGNGNSVIKSENNPLINSTTLVDGFTVTGGNNYFGGGIYCGSVSPSFSNLIIKNNFASNSGGGVYIYDGTPSFTNCAIINNNCSEGSNGNGGGIYNDNAYPSLTKCAIANNFAGRDGGGMYTYEEAQFTNSRKPALTNCVIAHNEAGSGAGGGLFGYNTSYIVTNCTIFGNTSYLANCGAGIHNYSPNSSQQSSSVITNCIFWLNRVGINGFYIDVWNTNVTSTVTYSMLVSTPAGAGNVGPSTPDPFIDGMNGVGNDNVWMTADDGFQLSPCKTPLAVDKGSNTAIGTVATDILGNPRKINNPLIADGGQGTAPIVDMGAYENQTTVTPAQLAGSIGYGHTVPNPQELKTDSVANVIAPAAGMQVIRWEKSIDGGSSWNPATPAGTLNYYRFSDSIAQVNVTATTLYRRVVSSATYCNVPYYAEPVQIKVVVPNGQITGQVTSKNGVTGIPGVTINVTRTGRTPISGANPAKLYTATTDGNGYYTVSRIYYGDPDPGLPSKDTFRIIPQKTNHLFNPSVFNGKELTSSAPQPSFNPVDFVDTTALIISGNVWQKCSTCTVLGSTVSESQTCPLDSVRVSTGSNQFLTQRIGGQHGKYTLTVTDPGLTTITPSFKNGQHLFDSAYRTLNITESVSNVDFTDTTTHVLSGFFRAGCNSYIGQAVLEFTDILPNEADGSPRSSCFSKRLTVNSGSGFYSVRLPARKYKVELVGFTNSIITNVTDPAYVSLQNLTEFFNTLLPKDSLIRDITLKDTTLDLTFLRKPVIDITQGLNIICATPAPGYALYRQGVLDSFRIKVFQGPVSLGCAITDTTNKINLYTAIDTVDNVARLHAYNPSANGTLVKLKGGTPFIAGDYYKPFNIQYTDKYNRSVAQLSRNVIVTGIKADTATFTTVSPEIPMLVLHDPPGDGSNSYWQSNTTISNSLRLYAAKGNETNVWLQAKIGAKFEAGLGVSTESSVWGTLGGNIAVASANTTSDETITTVTTSQTFSTSGNPTVTGQSGDVYVGAALNLIYAGATELKYENCGIQRTRKLIVADQGFNTQYVYSESHIKNVVIPTQLALSRNPGNTPQQIAYYLNQASVWQQVLDNNAENKAKATFVKNVSFDAATGPQSGSVTTSRTKTNTVEFSMAINAGLAAELGFEVAGSGASGGVNVNFKTETGQSQTTTNTQETTIGYTITDDDAGTPTTPGDYFTVDVKRDNVYGTPLFELKAGTSSCPAEPGTQHRDAMELYAPVPVQSNIPANDTAYFYLYLANLSESGEARTYNLYLDQTGSNTGAAISIQGSQAQSGIAVPINVGYLAQVPILIGVKRLTSVYSFEGISFTATDACASGSSNVSKTVLISANFANSCSGVTMASPENGWVANNTFGNSIPIQIAGYDVTRFSSVAFQYAKAGTGNWITAFSRPANQLNPDGASGTSVPWDITNVTDSLYDLRLQLSCGTTNIYAQRASGLIDRRAPVLLGNPDPTDGNYINGDMIAFTYNEKLNVNNLNTGNKVIMTRLSNNTNIPVTVSGYENRIVIVPTNNISSYTGETIRVIVTGMSDLQGNVKTAPDTSYFLVGTTIAATGTNALTVDIATPVVYKNSDSTIKVLFKLPVARTTTDTRVNYTVSGTARLGIDYSISYGRVQPSYTYFNGSQGAISIGKDSLSTVLRISPIGDTSLSPDKTIIISLAEGGDYALGATTSRTGTISSEDSIMVYTFLGNGYFNTRSNWLNGKMPLTTLAPGKEIIINPITGTCTLNIPLTIRPNAKLTVKENKQFIIPGNVKVQNINP